MRADCYFCHIKTIQELVEKVNPDNSVAEDFIFSIHELLHKNREMNNPMLSTNIHRIAKDKLKVNDLYACEKRNANQTLIDGFKHWHRLITKSKNSFYAAAKLAVIGNIIDYGAHSLKGDIPDQLNELLFIPLKVDKSDELKRAIQKAKSILYLGDNAGEVFFDKLFIEEIKHPNITFVTRAYPVINDVTFDDVKQVGIDKLCKVISNGFDAPSTLLAHCSAEFKEAYYNADLIISKGQGNFEGLMNENHPNTFFMLIAKCKPMAELLGVEKNDMVITKIKN